MTLFHDFKIEECDRQLIILACAKLALSRPGFDYALGQIADQMGGREMYETFKSHGPDKPDPFLVKPAPPQGR